MYERSANEFEAGVGAVEASGQIRGMTHFASARIATE